MTYKCLDKFLQTSKGAVRKNRTVEIDGFSVLAGVTDEDSIRTYTEGQCHALAFAIYELTGWPLVWLGTACCDMQCAEYDLDKTCKVPSHITEHVMVLHPSGKWLDIAGLHEPEVIKPVWATQHSGILSEDDAQEFIDTWPHANIRLARTFAKETVKALG